MADLSVLASLDRVELVELVSVLAFRAGDLPDQAVAEARFHAAARRVELASEAVEEALKAYVRAGELHDRAIAEGRRPARALSSEVGRLAAAYRVACERERKALAKLGRARMEAGC